MDKERWNPPAEVHSSFDFEGGNAARV